MGRLIGPDQKSAPDWGRGRPVGGGVFRVGAGAGAGVGLGEDDLGVGDAGAFWWELHHFQSRGRRQRLALTALKSIDRIRRMTSASSAHGRR